MKKTLLNHLSNYSSQNIQTIIKILIYISYRHISDKPFGERFPGINRTKRIKTIMNKII